MMETFGEVLRETKLGFPEQKREPAVIDPVIEAVRRDLHDRSQVGIQKYGTTLAENYQAHRDRLQHAYEEALDLANYLKWAILQLDQDYI